MPKEFARCWFLLCLPPSAVAVTFSLVFWICPSCASDGSPSKPIKSAYVTLDSVVSSSISVSPSFLIMSPLTLANYFAIKYTRFMGFFLLHIVKISAFMLDTVGLIMEYRMHVIISLYAHPRSTSFVFVLWVFRFWFSWGFFEVYPCWRCLLFPYFGLSLDSSLVPCWRSRSLFFRALTPCYTTFPLLVGETLSSGSRNFTKVINLFSNLRMLSFR